MITISKTVVDDGLVQLDLGIVKSVKEEISTKIMPFSFPGGTYDSVFIFGIGGAVRKLTIEGVVIASDYATLKAKMDKFRAILNKMGDGADSGYGPGTGIHWQESPATDVIFGEDILVATDRVSLGYTPTSQGHYAFSYNITFTQQSG